MNNRNFPRFHSHVNRKKGQSQIDKENNLNPAFRKKNSPWKAAMQWRSCNTLVSNAKRSLDQRLAGHKDYLSYEKMFTINTIKAFNIIHFIHNLPVYQDLASVAANSNWMKWYDSEKSRTLIYIPLFYGPFLTHV